MMHQAPPPRRSGSLLERAAARYDFGTLAKPAPFPAEQRPDAAPAATARAPDQGFAPVDMVAPHAGAPVGERRFGPIDTFAGPDRRRPVAAGEPVAIDRLMLAEKGMIVPGAPIGPLAEEFRLIKRQLLITRERLTEAGERDKARSVLVCSARPGDGKTFCAINLALSMAAERDIEVLLVDADFAKPDVMTQLGLEDGPGLLDALADSHLDPETLVRATDVPHLSVLPAGTKTATDTELLASARTKVVLARLLAANPRRVLLFDSPPVLAASPASVLAMLVGQVMLVVRADHTPEGELSAAVGQLDACEHIALVLNAVSFVPGGSRFGSYYGQEDRT
jgi:Mrp family chromosome partitioning ATPase